jgi:hypothetical protein
MQRSGARSTRGLDLELVGHGSTAVRTQQTCGPSRRRQSFPVRGDPSL